jgi:hypothetical protein
VTSWSAKGRRVRRKLSQSSSQRGTFVLVLFIRYSGIQKMNLPSGGGAISRERSGGEIKWYSEEGQEKAEVEGGGKVER